MKQVSTAATAVAVLVFAAPAFAAQDTAPGTSVQTGAAAANQINGSAESNPPNAGVLANATAKNKTVARVSTPDPMMSRLHPNDKASGSADTLNQPSVQLNSQQ